MIVWATVALQVGALGSAEALAAEGLPVGPAAVGLWDGELGRARSVYPRTEIGLAPHLLLLVDTPAFYGQVQAGAALEASFAADPSTGLWLRLEPVHYRNVISAIPSDFLGYGFTTLGLTRRLDTAGKTAVAFQSELVLPSAIGLYGHSWPFGLDVALAADRAYGVVSVHGQLGYVMSAAATRGPSQLRSGFAGTAGGVWQPGGAFAVVLDLQGAAGVTAVLDHLAVAPGVRFAAGAWGLELAAALPLAGRERALAAAELHSTVRF